MAHDLKDFRDFPRCWAPVALSYRQRTLDKRASRDASRRCSLPGYVKVEGHMYCSVHFRAWQVHHRILDRIRSIPDRDIV